jgi:hypothetical protein
MKNNSKLIRKVTILCFAGILFNRNYKEITTVKTAIPIPISTVADPAGH